MDLEAVAKGGSSLSFQKAEAGPQVLIMHTHGTESYARDGTEPYTETGVARTTDTSYNIIRVGDEIARIFEEMGLNVIHDRELYDYPSYNDAYDKARRGSRPIWPSIPPFRWCWTSTGTPWWAPTARCISRCFRSTASKPPR